MKKSKAPTRIGKSKKIIPVLIILLGFVGLLYPWISEYLFENRTDSLVETYQAEVEDIGDGDKDEMLSAAKAYNKSLNRATAVLSDPFAVIENSDVNGDYNAILRTNSLGLMGTIEIPCIDVNLPIYHGTSEEVLQTGVGHLEQSSFPIGGESTHAILSAHTGLNTAKLFTDLTEVKKGDQFYIHILGDVYAYEVRDINVVEPADTSLLQIKTSEDLVTLVTCTPYGINSHRLLVTGERVEYIEEKHTQESEKQGEVDSNWMKQYKKAIIYGLIISAVLILLYKLFERIQQWRKGK